MKNFVAGANDDGKRLDKYMSKLVSVGGGAVYKALRKKKVKVNGKRITDGAFRLKEGDALEIYINDELFSDSPVKAPRVCGGDINVVYEDEHIIIADKPAGLLSQAGEAADSLEGRMRAYLYTRGEYDPRESLSFVPSLCHRIDRNTSGLVIGAKNAESLRILNRKIKNREIKKYYLCETESAPTADSGEIHGWLKKDETLHKMIFCKNATDGATECLTRYRVLDRGETCLIEAELLTGKTHQLRASFAHIGCPLVGDVKYGAKNDGKRRYQHLKAYRIEFAFTSDGGVLEYLNGRSFMSGGEKNCFV